MNYLELDLYQIREQLNKGEVSATELIEQCFENIKKNKHLNCLISTYEEEGMQRAKTIDEARKRGEKVGVLAGIPFVLSDNINLKGTKTTCASKFLENFVSPYTATCAQKLIDAGAIIIGKANMDEFGMGSSNETSAFGAVLNPLNNQYVSGGSNGGSAVTIATKQCFGALGTDTSGSIRVPASFCGIVGLKPTYGRVSRYGVGAFASSLDQIGSLTSSVRDSAIMLNVLAGKDAQDMTSSDKEVPNYEQSIDGGVKGLKIGIAKQFFNESLDPEVRSSLEKAIQFYKSQGAELVDISLPNLDSALAVCYILSSAEASSNLARFDGVKYGRQAPKYDDLVDLYFKSRTQGFGKEVKRRIMFGNYVLSSGCYDVFYRKAKRVQKVIIREFEQAFEKCDIMLSPTTASPAFKIGEKSEDHIAMSLTDIFTVPVNIAGLPALSVPCGKNSKGLSIGMQLIAPHWKEDRLFSAGYCFEQASKEGQDV